MKRLREGYDPIYIVAGVKTMVNEIASRMYEVDNCRFTTPTGIAINTGKEVFWKDTQGFLSLGDNLLGRLETVDQIELSEGWTLVIHYKDGNRATLEFTDFENNYFENIMREYR